MNARDFIFLSAYIQIIVTNAHGLHPSMRRFFFYYNTPDTTSRILSININSVADNAGNIRSDCFKLVCIYYSNVLIALSILVSSVFVFGSIRNYDWRDHSLSPQTLSTSVFFVPVFADTRVLRIYGINGQVIATALRFVLKQQLTFSRRGNAFLERISQETTCLAECRPDKCFSCRE